MKRILSWTLLIVAAIAASGCTTYMHHTKQLANLAAGMTKEEVTRVMGHPPEKSLLNEYGEYFIYQDVGTKPVYVRFSEGRVTGFGNVGDPGSPLPPWHR